jgi:DNA polymerase III alpha subunit
MDVDIDIQSSFKPEEVFPDWVRASTLLNGELRPHPCGVYPQEVGVDPVSHLAAAPFKVLEELGYLKVDFLHNTVYDHFTSQEEITTLLNMEPEWKLLLIPSVQEKLFQLSKHGEMLDIVRPSNIEELADVLALIRPGKRKLLDYYLTNKEKARRLLYAKTAQYYFKRSHAIGYAMVIVLQLHLIHMGVI